MKTINLNLEEIVNKVKARVAAGVRNAKENAIGYTVTGLLIGNLVAIAAGCAYSGFVEPYRPDRIRQLSEKAGWQSPEDVKKATTYDDTVYGIALKLRDGTVLCFQSYTRNSQSYALARSFSKNDPKAHLGCEYADSVR